MNPLRIHLATIATPLVRKAIEMLGRELQERANVTLEPSEAAKADVVLEMEPAAGAEGYRIEPLNGHRLRIAAGDERGLLYGVGRFLHDGRWEPEAFHPGDWRGLSRPQRRVRGVYFATHFHNFYHDAPIKKVRRYIEELALWGGNALGVWFDMHHFRSIRDPAAQSMVKRLRQMVQAANGVGMGGTLFLLANEGYADTPEQLRADWTAGHDGYHHAPGGHYHVEVCPSAPGGLEHILRLRREMLEAFEDIHVEYVTIWPYDQGGCTCSKCTPWGTNGFLRTAAAVAGQVRQVHPSSKIILSTWYFDHFVDGEWKGLDEAFRKKRPEWCDYLMADDAGDQFPAFPLKHGVPGGLPLVSFPEISMYRMSPWGGFGANPLPRLIQDRWCQCGDRLAGGFPYSEGIFEDLNKVITLQQYWEGADALETVRRYAAYEYSSEAATEVAEVIQEMESQHGYQVAGEANATALLKAPRLKNSRLRLDRLVRVEKLLPLRVRNAWRWRILRLRATIDAEIEERGGKMTDALEACFNELTRIYHAQNAEAWVAPPSRQALQRERS